jgi:hypothetical protein
VKRETLFLKGAVILIGIPILGLCIFGLPMIVNEAAEHYPAYLLYPVLIGMYAAAVPFFFALYQTLKLLSYIDKNNAFSELSVKALKSIKYCAITISILYAGLILLLIPMAEIDDAQGIVALGLVITFASIVVAVFAAVLQKLLKNAIDIKSENDLTV